MSCWHRSGTKTAWIMGVLNCTPDSFSDGGHHTDNEQAVNHGLRMWQQGANLIDVGGESTRPGALAVTLDEELRRVIPVIMALVAAGCRVSVDTMKAEVMRQAVVAGATMINDVSALSFDPASMEVAANCDVAVCLMHMQGSPTTMQNNPHYDDDVVTTVIQYFEQRLLLCQQAGIRRERIVLDPGIGFGKRLQDNLTLIARVDELRNHFSLPVLLGVSRKSFLGNITGQDVTAREWATASAVAVGCFAGADILRVHDVAHQQQVIAVAAALRDARRP
ncbi:MAG: dihydropteroate synthase [Mariprofundaceae bacterium]|nr:dihydropteroate synthase [Mariprofundaceae bacterium]